MLSRFIYANVQCMWTRRLCCDLVLKDKYTLLPIISEMFLHSNY